MKTRQYFSLMAACLILAIAPACGNDDQAAAPDSETTTEQTEAPTGTTPEDSATEPPETPETAEAPAEPNEAAEAPATQENATAEPYPPEAAAGFINGCVSAAVSAEATEEQATAYCNCTLDEIQKEYSFEEFAEVDRQLQEGGEPPAEFERIVNFCVDQTINAS